jgi:mannosylglycerate hydrolase
MNGFDHLPPDTTTAEVAAELTTRLGVTVQRALLDDAASMLDADDRPCFAGPLIGARIANLLPGVWSSRMPLKLANRACESLLVGWAEPWAALGGALGLDDERPALELAWQTLLQNQAHDSLCGCSIDHVHAQVHARFDTVTDMASTTTTRILERLAGRDVTGALNWGDEHDLVVFNPSPHAKTGIVRVPIDVFPPWRVSIDRFELHPLSVEHTGFTVGGVAARVVASDDPARVRFLPDQAPLDLEIVARDVPAFGCWRAPMRAAGPAPDRVDDGTEISTDDVAVRANDDGTLDVRLGDREHHGLFGLEDVADRGDSYDFDPLPGDDPVTLTAHRSVIRTIHESGIRRLQIARTVALPAGLEEARARRTPETVPCELVLEALLVPGVPWIAVTVTFENAVRDHRLRLRFPTEAHTDELRAATTFGAMTRSTTLPDASTWLHPAPATFPHQGWIEANGLVVGAPGLPEAEVTPDGTILVTLVRSVGWLARFDVSTRPIPAGPEMPAPGAQVPGPITARFVLARDPRDVQDAELGLHGVLGGPDPLLEPGDALLTLEPGSLSLSACKPADDGDGIVVRVMNATDAPEEAVLRLGFGFDDAIAVRLDETPSGEPIARDETNVRFPVPAHALRSVRLRPARRRGSREVDQAAALNRER